MKPKVGDKVYVEWLDAFAWESTQNISQDFQHEEKDAWTMGIVEEVNDRYLIICHEEIGNSDQSDDRKEGTAIPWGCIESIEVWKDEKNKGKTKGKKETITCRYRPSTG